MRILLIGMNHQSAPLAVREHFVAEAVGPALRKLIAYDEIEEAVLVSTCNRVDLIVTTQRVDDARHQMMRFFRNEFAGGEPIPGGGHLEEFSYEHRDLHAVTHIFRVASSLDSMVLGEPQILGQMKQAYRVASLHGASGPVLSRLFQRAFATAKRVKNETRIAQRPVSVARVAVDLASQIFEDLHAKRALLLGAGEMIELALLALQREGLTQIQIANRTAENAEELARRFGASAHALDALPELLGRADVVLSCVGGDRPLLSFEMVRDVLEARRSRPIFFIDIGVPRNVDPQVDELDNAYLYDIDDLQGVVDTNTDERRREAGRGEFIVQEETQQFESWLASLANVPTIRHVRTRAEAIRESEVRHSLDRLGLDERQLEGVERLTRSIVNKILHAPISRLRGESDREAGSNTLEAARQLFALDDSTAPGAQADAALRAEVERERLAGRDVTEAPPTVQEDPEDGA